MKKIVAITSFLLLIDQGIKMLIDHIFALNEPLVLIPHFFSLTKVQNTGAAWSIFEGNQLFLILISIFAIFFLYFFFIYKKKLTTFEIFSFGLLFGGTLGNLVDRIFRGHVIDYLDFTIFGYSFPIFNFADICIVVSIIFLCIWYWRDEQCKNSLQRKKRD